MKYLKLLIQCATYNLQTWVRGIWYWAMAVSLIGCPVDSKENCLEHGTVTC